MAEIKKGHIKQRDKNTWQITIDTGQLNPNGKRKRVFKTVKGTRADADKMLREMLVQLDKGQLSTSTLTVSEWMSVWLRDYVGPRRRQATVEKYERTIRNHIGPALGSIRLNKLRPHDVTRAQNEWAKTMKATTVNTIRAILSSAFKQAERLDLIPASPIWKATALPEDTPEVKPPSIQDVDDILEYAKSINHRFYAAFHLAAYTGLRKGELLGLTWERINLLDRQLVVDQTVQHLNTGLTIGKPKSDRGKRVVNLDDYTIEVLKEHRRQQDELRAFMRRAYVDRGLVFTTETGGPVQPNVLLKCLKSVGRTVGNPSITMHSFRHYHASVLLQAGIALPTVSERMGHASKGFTLSTYAHSLPGWQQEAADEFAAFVGRKGKAGDSVGILSARDAVGAGSRHE